MSARNHAGGHILPPGLRTTGRHRSSALAWTRVTSRPGADDNASGVTVLLELGAVLPTGAGRWLA